MSESSRPAHSIRYHSGALQDLQAARRHYLASSASAADDFADAVDRTALRLAEFPRSGTPLRGDVRGTLIAGFPYRIVYQVHNETVRILAVAHTSRRPGYWRTRV